MPAELEAPPLDLTGLVSDAEPPLDISRFVSEDGGMIESEKPPGFSIPTFIQRQSLALGSGLLAGIPEQAAGALLNVSGTLRKAARPVEGFGERALGSFRRLVPGMQTDEDLLRPIASLMPDVVKAGARGIESVAEPMRAKYAAKREEFEKEGQTLGGGPVADFAAMISGSAPGTVANLLVTLGIARGARLKAQATRWTGSLLEGAMQGGGTYSHAYETYLKHPEAAGMEPEARKEWAAEKAATAGTASAVATALIARGFAARDLNKLITDPRTMAPTLWVAAKKIGKELLGYETFEEGTQGAFQAVVENLTFRPEATWQDNVRDIFMSAVAGGVMSSGIHGVKHLAQVKSVHDARKQLRAHAQSVGIAPQAAGNMTIPQAVQAIRPTMPLTAQFYGQTFELDGTEAPTAATRLPDADRNAFGERGHVWFDSAQRETLDNAMGVVAGLLTRGIPAQDVRVQAQQAIITPVFADATAAFGPARALDIIVDAQDRAVRRTPPPLPPGGGGAAPTPVVAPVAPVAPTAGAPVVQQPAVTTVPVVPTATKPSPLASAPAAPATPQPRGAGSGTVSAVNVPGGTATAGPVIKVNSPRKGHFVAFINGVIYGSGKTVNEAKQKAAAAWANRHTPTPPVRPGPVVNVPGGQTSIPQPPRGRRQATPPGRQTAEGVLKKRIDDLIAAASKDINFDDTAIRVFFDDLGGNFGGVPNYSAVLLGTIKNEIAILRGLKVRNDFERAMAAHKAGKPMDTTGLTKAALKQLPKTDAARYREFYDKVVKPALALEKQALEDVESDAWLKFGLLILNEPDQDVTDIIKKGNWEVWNVIDRWAGARKARHKAAIQQVKDLMEKRKTGWVPPYMTGGFLPTKPGAASTVKVFMPNRLTGKFTNSVADSLVAWTLTRPVAEMKGYLAQAAKYFTPAQTAKHAQALADLYTKAGMPVPDSITVLLAKPTQPTTGGPSAAQTISQQTGVPSQFPRTDGQWEEKPPASPRDSLQGATGQPAQAPQPAAADVAKPPPAEPASVPAQAKPQTAAATQAAAVETARLKLDALGPWSAQKNTASQLRWKTAKIALSKAEAVLTALEKEAGKPESAPATLPAQGGVVIATGKPNGAQVEIAYDLIEAADLKPMTVMKVGADQTRERSSRASREQIQNIADHTDPAQVGESSNTVFGAPIVDDVVLAGNGRASGLILGYETNTASIQRYKAWVLEKATALGLDASGMKQPVFVRRLLRYVKGTRQQVVEESNPRQAILAETAPEAALLDARAIGDLTTLEFIENGDLASTSAAQVATALEQAQRGVKRSTTGIHDSAELNQRVRLAFLARMVEEAGMDIGDLAGIIESDDGKRILKEIIVLAPRLGLLDADLSLDSPILRAFVELGIGIRAVNGRQYATMQDWADNRASELIKANLSWEAERLLAVMLDGFRKPLIFRQVMDRYLTLATHEQAQRKSARESGDIFGGTRENVPARTLLARATSLDADLFSPADDAAKAAAPGDSGGVSPPVAESKLKQISEPIRFESVDDLLKFRKVRLEEERALYVEQIGLTEEQAVKLQNLLNKDADTSRFEKTLNQEQRRRLEAFFDGPFNQIGGPFIFWEGDIRLNPDETAQETDPELLASILVSAVRRGIEEGAINDRFISAVIAARRLQELGFTKSDIARYLDKYTTRESSSQGDKVEFFKNLGGKVMAFLQKYGIDLPEGTLGRQKSEPRHAGSGREGTLLRADKLRDLVVKGTNARVFLSELTVERNEIGGVAKLLLKHVPREQLEALDVGQRTSSQPDDPVYEDRGGYYDITEHKATIHPDSSISSIGLHEIVHGLTVLWLSDVLPVDIAFTQGRGPAYMGALRAALRNPKTHPAARELIEVFLDAGSRQEPSVKKTWRNIVGSARFVGEQVRPIVIHPSGGDLGAEVQYGMANLEEFIAEALSNFEFQEWLASKKSTRGGRSVWARFVDAICRVLGLPVNQSTLLADALRASAKIIQLQAEAGLVSSILDENGLPVEVEPDQADSGQIVIHPAPGREGALFGADKRIHARMVEMPANFPVTSGPLVERVRGAIERSFGAQAAHAPLSIISPEAALKSSQEAEALRRVEDFFQRRILFFQSDSTQVLALDGFMSPSYPGVVFVNAHSSTGWSFVMGHEMLHQMRAQNPDLYDWLYSVAYPELMKFDEYSRNLDASYRQKGGGDAVAEELMADLFGANLNKPEFWEKIGSLNPTLFQKIAAFVRDFFRRFVASMDGFEGSKFVKDANKVLDAMALAATRFAERSRGHPLTTGFGEGKTIQVEGVEQIKRMQRGATQSRGLTELRAILDNPASPLNASVRKLLLYLLDQPVMQELDWSPLVVQFGATDAEGVAGFAEPRKLLIGLTDKIDALAAPHEVFHILWAMLPHDVRKPVIQAWQSALAESRAANEHRFSKEPHLKLFFDLAAQPGGMSTDQFLEFKPLMSPAEWEAFASAFYPLRSPSEFMAVMAADHLSEKAQAESWSKWLRRHDGALASVVRRIREWLKGLVAGIRAVIFEVSGGRVLQPDLKTFFDDILEGRYLVEPSVLLRSAENADKEGTLLLDTPEIYELMMNRAVKQPAADKQEQSLRAIVQNDAAVGFVRAAFDALPPEVRKWLPFVDGRLKSLDAAQADLPTTLATGTLADRINALGQGEAQSNGLWFSALLSFVKMAGDARQLGRDIAVANEAVKEEESRQARMGVEARLAQMTGRVVTNYRVYLQAQLAVANLAGNLHAAAQMQGALRWLNNAPVFAITQVLKVLNTHGANQLVNNAAQTGAHWGTQLGALAAGGAAFGVTPDVVQHTIAMLQTTPLPGLPPTVARLEAEAQQKQDALDFYRAEIEQNPRWRDDFKAAAARFDAETVVRRADAGTQEPVWQNPYDANESVTLSRDFTFDAYEKNRDRIIRALAWFEKAMQDPVFTPLEQASHRAAWQALNDRELNQQFNPQTGTSVPHYNPLWPQNLPQVLQKIGAGHATTPNDIFNYLGGRVADEARSTLEHMSNAGQAIAQADNLHSITAQTTAKTAADTHGMSVTDWKQRIGDRILGSWQNQGDQRKRLGDTVNGYEVLKEDIEAVNASKAYNDANRDAVRLREENIHGQRNKLLVSRSVGGTSFVSRAVDVSGLTVPQRVRPVTADFIKAWREIDSDLTNKVITSAQALQAFEALMDRFGYESITSMVTSFTNPVFAADAGMGTGRQFSPTPFKDIYRALASEIDAGTIRIETLGQLADAIFARQTGATVMALDEIKARIVAETDAMIDRFDGEERPPALVEDSSSVSFLNAENFVNRPRAKRVLPSGWYSYTLPTNIEQNAHRDAYYEVLTARAVRALDRLEEAIRSQVTQFREFVNRNPKSGEKWLETEQANGSNFLNFPHATTMLDRVQKIRDQIRESAHAASTIDAEFLTLGRTLLGATVDSLLQKAGVLINNFFGAPLYQATFNKAMFGLGNILLFPVTLPWLVGVNAVRSGVEAMRQVVAVLGSMNEPRLQAALAAYHANPVFWNSFAGWVVPKVLAQVARTRAMQAAGVLTVDSWRENIRGLLAFPTQGGVNMGSPSSKTVGVIKTIIRLFTEVGLPFKLPRALGSRVVDLVADARAQRDTELVVERLKENSRLAMDSRATLGLTPAQTTLTPQEVFGDDSADLRQLGALRNFMAQSGINLDRLLIEYWQAVQTAKAAGTPVEDVLFLAPGNPELAARRFAGLRTQKAMWNNRGMFSNRPIRTNALIRAFSTLFGWAIDNNAKLGLLMAKHSRYMDRLEPRTAKLMVAVLLMTLIMGNMAYLLRELIERWVYREEKSVPNPLEARTAGEAARSVLARSAGQMPMVGNAMSSMIFPVRPGAGNVLGFNFLPVSVLTKLVTWGQRVSGSGNLVRPTLDLMRDLVPQTRIWINRLPVMQGVATERAARAILTAHPPAGVEVRTGGAPGVRRYSAASGSADDIHNELARDNPDPAAMRRYREEGIARFVAAGQTPEAAAKAFDRLVLSRDPFRQVYGAGLTAEQRTELQGRLSPREREIIGTVERGMQSYARQFGRPEPDFIREPRQPNRLRGERAEQDGEAQPASVGRASGRSAGMRRLRARRIRRGRSGFRRVAIGRPGRLRRGGGVRLSGLRRNRLRSYA